MADLPIAVIAITSCAAIIYGSLWMLAGFCAMFERDL